MAQTDYSAFRTLSLAFVAPDGNSYINTTDASSNTDFLAVANEGLKRFSEETYCLFADNVPLTLTPNTSIYSLRDTTAFGKEMLELQRVYISGSPIYQTTEEEISRLYPAYLTGAANSPSLWWTMPPNQVEIYPKPDQVYSNCFVSGWYVHPTITAESGAGGTIFLRPEDIRCAAREVAIAILEPRAIGDSLDRLNFLRAENKAEKEKIRARAGQLFEAYGPRRSGRSVYSLR